LDPFGGVWQPAAHRSAHRSFGAVDENNENTNKQNKDRLPQGQSTICNFFGNRTACGVVTGFGATAAVRARKVSSTLVRILLLRLVGIALIKSVTPYEVLWLACSRRSDSGARAKNIASERAGNTTRKNAWYKV